MLVATAAPSSSSVASAAAVKGNWFLASPERLRPGEPSAFLALVERGLSCSCGTCSLPEVPIINGTTPLSEGVSNRKGAFWPSSAFWVARVESVIVPARIKVTVWTEGDDVLAAVKPEEIYVPNCSAKVGPDRSALLACTTGFRLLRLPWEIASPKVPLAPTLKVEAFNGAPVLAMKSWPLESTCTATALAPELITALT